MLFKRYGNDRLQPGKTYRDYLEVLNESEHCFTLIYKDPSNLSMSEIMGQIEYDERKSQLIFRNKGKIPTYCILLGGSTKMNDLNQIGKFGEGFKVAALVLLRGFNKDVVRDNKSLPTEGTPEW